MQRPTSQPSSPTPHQAVRNARLFAFRRGLTAGAAALLFVALAAAPARVAGASRVDGRLADQALWMLAGLVRDLAVIVVLIAPVMLLVAGVVPLVARFRHARWQSAGVLFGAAPFCVVVWVFGIVAQEFKFERGSYPTVFDLSGGASSSAFLKGTLGFLRYDVFWIPALVFGLAGLALLVFRVRRARQDVVLSWRPWLLGVALALAVGAVGLRLSAAGIGTSRGRITASKLGDPFRAIVDSASDFIAYGANATPRDFVRDAKIPGARPSDGAALLGWPARAPSGIGPACVHHPHARSLDREKDPPIADPRGAELVSAFEAVSDQLFPLDDDGVVVWQVTLESFRADDLQAMNPDAARETAPFVNGLYEATARPGGGVLASRATYQAGVRTAQGLGALACGLGTLPYNLSLIRDLQPFAVRCLSDVLGAAGFRASFFYGSDVSFDGMGAFFRAHGFTEQITQSELPADAPTGAWGAVTDLALVDETTRRVASSVESEAGPRLVMLTTLSNHSPFVAPADLPPDVVSRVEHALATVPNHAGRDDRARLLTHSYTDAAVARLFERLDALHLAARSIVVLSADHSTGESYVWAAGDESDEAKGRIPFAIVLPDALRERARDRAALDAAIGAAQHALAAGPLSQNDIPTLILSLLHAHPAVRGLAPDARWHTLGGQVTSPWFRPVSRPGSYIIGVNGVSQFVALDREGARVGDYEESSFLKTRSDLSSVTPSLLPITATLSAILRAPADPCAGPARPER